MITRIDITDFRGIAKAELGGLTPLTVLTGPNACGKSAVLDALLIAASGGRPEAVARAVQRHPEVPGGAHWLVRSGAEKAHLLLREQAGGALQYLLFVRAPSIPGDAFHVQTNFRHASNATSRASITSFGVSNGVEGESGEGLPADRPSPVLLDPALPVRLEDDWSAAVRAGARKVVQEAVEEVLPGFEGFEVIKGFDGNLELLMYLGGQRPVPLNMSGDGVISFVQTVIQLAPVGDGLALIEEPEVCQHPSALRGTAQAIVQAVRRGTQVVLTTHSVEFIDHLVLALGEDGIDKISIHNLARKDGVISRGVMAGEDVRRSMGNGVDPR